MEIKLIEIRDDGTLVPAMAVRLNERNAAEHWLLLRAGYANDRIIDTNHDEPYVLLTQLFGSGHCHYDPFAWNSRTMKHAHMFLIQNWNQLSTGDVVDVEFILGERPTPKVSERNRRIFEQKP